MNSIQFSLRHFRTITLLPLLIASITNSYGGPNDCWVDFFEESEYSGKHLLLKGPVKLESLKAINSENWDKRIDSLKVGPKAKITVYQNPRFELTLTEMAKNPDFMKSWGITEQDIKEDSELIFNENAMIHDLGDFSFHKKIRSLKIDCF